MTPTTHEVDVLIVSDLRLPGGTAHSIAEEVDAQERAGLRSGLVQVNGQLVARVRPMNPALAARVRRGAAELLLPGDDVAAGVVVVRHPVVLRSVAAAALPAIRTQRVVIVANAGPRDVDGSVVYDVAEAQERARDLFGVDPLWAPIGPLVRATVESEVPAGRLLPEDWVNIIDVDGWAVERPGWSSDRPVVGRHSRPSAQKWPADAGTIRSVYPTDGSWEVRVLGGADPVADVLGSVPRSWDVRPFGAMAVRDFLAGLDFFVYYHDPRWVEAFGRTILEAIASGVPAVLPPHFRVLFGDAAVYAEPHDVRAVVERLRGDRPAYDRQVATARDLVRERFSYETHARRLRGLLGAQVQDQTVKPTAGPAIPRPGLAPTEIRTTGSPSAGRASGRPRVLLMSSNGAGMGHLTRLLAYAERLGAGVDAHFLSMSQAVPLVGAFGYRFEYLPSAKAVGMPPALWTPMFVERVRETVARVRPDVVVFDGTWPYTGIEEIRAGNPRPRWVWSRRGLWRQGLNSDQLVKADWFDAVLEPGDLAEDYDRGATVGAGARHVAPVTLLDREDLEDRDAARTVLGLPPEGPLALVSLGAGNINDTSSDLGAAIAALRSLGVGICVTVPEIASAGARSGGDVHLVRDYPLSRHYRAFDLAVSASGYNSFHELLRMGIPSLFVPNTATALDDQAARARFAADRGWAHHLPALADAGLGDLLGDLLDRGPAMVAGAVAADPGNGAAAAAEFLLSTAEEAR